MPGLSSAEKQTQGKHPTNRTPCLACTSFLRPQTSVPFAVPGKSAQHSLLTIPAVCARKGAGEKSKKERMFTQVGEEAGFQHQLTLRSPEVSSAICRDRTD